MPALSPDNRDKSDDKEDGMGRDMLRSGKLGLAALVLAAANAPAAVRAQSGEAEQKAAFDALTDFSTSTEAPAKTVDPSRFRYAMPPPAWTSRAGIDDSTALPDADLRQQSWVLGARPAQQVGVAWANITAPGLMAWDKTAFETRFDPEQENRFGVTLSRSVPVGRDVALTWQNAFAWTHPLLQGAPIVAHGGSPEVVEGAHTLRFTFLPANTTLSVGASSSSSEAGWRRSISAEQKLFGGPLSVTGTVSETSTGVLDRSLTAGFKRSW